MKATPGTICSEYFRSEVHVPEPSLLTAIRVRALHHISVVRRRLGVFASAGCERHNSIRIRDAKQVRMSGQSARATAEKNRNSRSGDRCALISPHGMIPCESSPNRQLSVTPGDAGCLKANVVCTAGEDVPHRLTSGTRSGGAIWAEVPALFTTLITLPRERLVGWIPRRFAGRYPPGEQSTYPQQVVRCQSFVVSDWTVPDSLGKVLAEGEGFEPPVPFRVQRFSRPPVSTAHPSLRGRGVAVALVYCMPACAWSQYLRTRRHRLRILSVPDHRTAGCRNWRLTRSRRAARSRPLQ